MTGVLRALQVPVGAPGNGTKAVGHNAPPAVAEHEAGPTRANLGPPESWRANRWEGAMIETVPDVDLIGGPEKRQIVLLVYDPAWEKKFETERRKVVGALGLLPHRVEHVGSTSVPGLAAKPIIDIQLSVPNVEDENGYVPQLEPAGYKLRVREHGHRMLRTASRTAICTFATPGATGSAATCSSGTGCDARQRTGDRTTSPSGNW
jgi:hypothetical protein